MKFSATPFVIDKRYTGGVIQRGIQIFVEATRSRKTPHQVFVTLAGLQGNSYSHELVDKEIHFDELLQC